MVLHDYAFVASVAAPAGEEEVELGRVRVRLEVETWDYFSTAGGRHRWGRLFTVGSSVARGNPR